MYTCYHVPLAGVGRGRGVRIVVTNETNWPARQNSPGPIPIERIVMPGRNADYTERTIPFPRWLTVQPFVEGKGHLDTAAGFSEVKKVAESLVRYNYDGYYAALGQNQEEAKWDACVD